MKKLLLILLCLPLMFNSCKKEEEDNNTPTNSQNVICYGINASELYKSTDEGKNWQKVAYKNFQELDFISEEIGYGIAQNILWKTTDGGSNWTELELSNDTLINGSFGSNPIAISKIQALDENIIFHLYPNTSFYNPTMNTYFQGGTIVKTLDGGTSYSGLGPNFNEHGMYKDGFTNMYFLNEEIGWANRSTTLWRTNNGGVTWNIIDQMPPTTFGDESYNFVSESTGFYIGSNYLYKTTDGGLSWSIQDEISFNCFDFVSENIGYASNNSCTFKTIDGGLTWDTVSTMSFNPIVVIP